MSHSVYGGSHHKITNNNSTFIKLNKKRGTAAKGLGHSTTKKNSFDRRNSVTTQSSTEKNYSYIVGERRSLPTQSQSRSQSSHSQHNSAVCNGFKSQFEFTEQRCNYERIMQQQLKQQEQQKRQFQQYDRQTWPSELVSSCQILNSRIPSCNSDQGDGDPVLLLQSNAVASQFLALREFRIQNSNECYGNGRRIEPALQLPTGNFMPHSISYYPQELNTTSSPMPYALRQSLLRTELAKDISSRIARKEFINSGLNKSLALNYQPMY